MNYLRIAVLAIGAAALMALTTANASATELSGPEGMLKPGTLSSATAEGNLTLDAPFGNIVCNSSKVSGTSSNTGGSTETVVGTFSEMTLTECGSNTVTVLAAGSSEIHTQETSSNNNGTLTTSGTRITVIHLGVHCIAETRATTIGIVTGSATTGGNATLDISARIPIGEGEGGGLCGTSAPLTGSFKITSPSSVNVI